MDRGLPCCTRQRWCLGHWQNQDGDSTVPNVWAVQLDSCCHSLSVPGRDSCRFGTPHWNAGCPGTSAKWQTKSLPGLGLDQSSETWVYIHVKPMYWVCTQTGPLLSLCALWMSLLAWNKLQAPGSHLGMLRIQYLREVAIICLFPISLRSGW